MNAKFPSWYPGQEDIFESCIAWLNDNDSRFLCLSAPTGSGKSILAVLSAKMSGRRTVILTVTKGLQTQIMDDFGVLGAVDIRGQNAYSCKMVPTLRCDEGPCHEGFHCAYREKGCTYYDQHKLALAADIVVTNYAYLLAQTQYSEGLGEIGMLVCDEAHLAFASLESHLTTQIFRDESESCGVHFPLDAMETWQEWRMWATQAVPVVNMLVAQRLAEIKAIREAGDTPPGSLSRAYRNAVSLARRLTFVSTAIGKWVWEKVASGWKFTPVWPSVYSGMIFQTVEKVMLMSAVLTEKTADNLGVTEDRTFIDAPSYFPPENTPIIHIPTARIDYKASGPHYQWWAARIDEIIEGRMDRKGIVFTVSYDRRNTLLKRTRNRSVMHTHTTEDVIKMVQNFKNASPPAVLVSPAVTSGWDFLGEECEYIVIGKIPYPDTSSPVVKARTEDDPDWSSFMAMETLVQEAGRGSRASDDSCEVLVIDDNWAWYWPRYQHFAPGWFHQRVRGKRTHVPPAPPKQRGRVVVRK